jgi:hypothetical protein
MKDSVAPTWSSGHLDRIFDDLKGDMKSKQQIVLPIIDEILSSGDNELTEYQFNFLRDITVRTFYRESRVVFSKEDLKWLLEKFENRPTPQRATIIILLLEMKILPKEMCERIKRLLEGPKGESFYCEEE